MHIRKWAFAMVLFALAVYFFNPFEEACFFEYDSITYVHMAKAIAEAEFPIGFRYADGTPALQTTFPLGYPLAIAALSDVMPVSVAAFAVSLLAYVATVLVTFLLATRLGGLRAGLAASVFVALSSEMLFVAYRPISEMLGVLLLVSGWLALERFESRLETSRSLGRSASSALLPALAVGFILASACWVRFAFVVALPAGWLALGYGVWKHKVSKRAALAAVLASVVGLGGLLLLNLTMSGSVLGAYRPPPETGLLGNARLMGNALVRSLFGVIAHAESRYTIVLPALLLVLVSALFTVVLYRALRAKPRLSWLAATTFFCLYPAFLVVTRSAAHYDEFYPRFMAPLVVAVAIAVIVPGVTQFWDARRHHTLDRWAWLGFAMFVTSVSLQCVAWHGTARWASRAFWNRYPREIVTPERIQAASLASNGVLFSNDKLLLHVAERNAFFIGYDWHWWPTPLTHEHLRSMCLHNECFIYIRYDHHAFDIDVLGLVARQAEEGALESASLLHDDGRGRLYRIRNDVTLSTKLATAPR